MIFKFVGSRTIKRNMMMKSYSTWGPSYKVSFSLKINKLPRNEWTNIIDVTKGGKCCNIGDRIPGVYVRSRSRMVWIYFCSALNGNGNFCRWITVTMGKQYNITIQQSKKGGKYWYQILIPGMRTRRFLNTTPRKFTNVKLYTSDEWYPSFTSDLGTVSNLKIENQ